MGKFIGNELQLFGSPRAYVRFIMAPFDSRRNNAEIDEHFPDLIGESTVDTPFSIKCTCIATGPIFQKI